MSKDSFGMLIAYLVPGVTVLLGLSYHWPTVRLWLAYAPEDQPTIAGFLYLTLAATTAGIMASTIRWALIDTFHHLTGMATPSRDFRKLEAHLSAYKLLEHNHYVYYQHYSNMVVALVLLLLARLFAGYFDWLNVATISLATMYFVGSRDALKKYYQRVGALLA